MLVANNGTGALELLSEEKPDLILSDVMMPEMDGIALARSIRSQEQLRLIPIILLSAKGTKKSITEGFNAGAEVYLTKPIDNQILIAQIDALLTRENRLKELRNNNRHKKASRSQQLIRKVDELILRHLSDPGLSVEAIAEALHMSRPTLYRKWKKISDTTLNEYIVKTRLTEAIKIIREKEYSFGEASILTGFSDPAYFSRVFKKYYNQTPTEYFERDA